MKKIILLFVLILSVSCLDNIAYISSSNEEIKVVTIKLDIPDGGYSWIKAVNHLSSTDIKTIQSDVNVFNVSTIEDAVKLIASATSGYSFAGWDGIGISTNAATTIVSSEKSRTITAKFTNTLNPQSEVTIEAITEGLGDVYFEGIKHIYTYKNKTYASQVKINTQVEVTAVAKSGYKFSNWVNVCKNDMDKDVATIDVLNECLTIKAIFVPEQ